ncbi:HNH endonuclease [Bacillus paralicheniformis]|uniref:HNH endonuclease n=1 Tax=Bacillus paralicheniformis TaxID=1648923 RepID=UPI0013EF46B7|nr:HNH endonuclease signature motif containing protein [Bacillus paralicheniformis]QII47414.1 HNH endonuclease [Bacillus paralicheniformis]
MGNIRTTKEQVADYWFEIVDECGLSVDASEATERCWRCGYKARLERCHIVPESLGGGDSADNLVLLCKRCHIENPNVSDPEIMWDWIRAYGTPFYDTFWVIEGFKEYEFIYGKSFDEEVRERNIKNPEEIKRLINEEFERSSFHFGHPYFNRATLAGLIRTVLKKYDKDVLLKNNEIDV